MKTTLYLLLAIAVLLPLGACSDEDDGRDNSLAGSISYRYMNIEFDIYENSELIQRILSDGYMDINKKTNDMVSFSLDWKELLMSIEQHIQAYGKPYEVNFDQTAIGRVIIGGKEHRGIDITIEGNMKEPLLSTRTTPYRPHYECDLRFTFEINDVHYILHIKRL